MSLAASIQFPACLVSFFWSTRFGQCGSVWWDEIELHYCQECWWQINCDFTWQVLATDPGNPPMVWVWTTKTGQFGSRPVQQADPVTLGGPNPDMNPSTRGTHLVWLDWSVTICGSAFWVLHLWLNSDMRPIKVKYWQWYSTAYFQYIGHLSNLYKWSYAHYQILKMSFNWASKNVDRVSWVSWRVTCSTHSST